MIDKKTKSMWASAIMNNEKLAKKLSEALKSSPGSSKREIVSKMLKTLDRGFNPGRGGGATGSWGDNTTNKELTSVGWREFTSPNVANTQQPTTPTPPPVPEAPTATTGITAPQPTEAPPSEVLILPSTPQAETISTETTTEEKAPVPTSEIPTDLLQYGNQFYNDWYGSLTDDQKKAYRPLYETLVQGFGAPYFQQKMLEGSPEEIKAKFQSMFPGMPEEMIPSGASLARQVNSLEDALKNKYNLEAMEDNLQKLNEEGMNIEGDLTNYITARDQYIENLDGMIQGAKDASANMDLSDPDTRRTMNNYTNYLTILKGRQQKRYVDALKTGIDYYNSKLTRAKNDYDTAYQRFKDEFNKKASVTEEDWNVMNTMLQEMYDNVANRQEDILRNAQLQLDVTRTTQDIANEAAKQAEGLSGYDLTSTQIANIRSNFERYKKETGDERTLDELSPEEKIIFLNKTNTDTAIADAMIPGYVSAVINMSPEILDAKGNINYNKIPDPVRSDVIALVNETDDLAEKIVKNDPTVWDNESGTLLVDVQEWIRPLLLKLIEDKGKNIGWFSKNITGQRFWSRDPGWADIGKVRQALSGEVITSGLVPQTNQQAETGETIKQGETNPYGLK